MKKVRVNKKYGEWFYQKVKEFDIDFPLYYLMLRKRKKEK